MIQGRLKLGLVGPIPPPNGGMAMQTRQLQRLLTAEGFAVELVAVNPPYRPRWIQDRRGVRAAFRLIPYLFHLWRVAGEVQILHVMANSGWSWHLFAAPAIWIGRLRGKAVMVDYRGGAARAFLQRSARWVLPTLRRASLIVVPSAFLRGVFLAYGVSAVIIPNCVDLERFHPPKSPDSGRHNGPHVIVTRNLETVYDIATAIRAFHRIRGAFPAAMLTVAGSGPELASLLRLVQDLGLMSCVHFSGTLDRGQMAELYRSADLLLNPSLADNMPNSLLEAMASGVPIVSTDVGGISVMVRHEGNGLLVSAGDPEGMALSAMRILGDPELRENLIQAGLAQARRQSWPHIRRCWLDAYASLVLPSASN